MIARLIPALVAIALASTPATAQMFDGFLSAPGIGMLDTIRRNETFWEPLAKRGEQSGGAISKSPRVATVDPAALMFAPSLEARQRNLAGFVARTRAQDPENAARMEQLFASTDVFSAFAHGLAPKGLRIDNLADAFTVYWITAWEASRGISRETSRERANAVKAQATAALLATPQLASAAATQKQELAEALFVQSALIDAAMEQAADDAQRAAVGTAVRQGAKAIGLDLDAMVLSETGFEPTGR